MKTKFCTKSLGGPENNPTGTASFRVKPNDMPYLVVEGMPLEDYVSLTHEMDELSLQISKPQTIHYPHSTGFVTVRPTDRVSWEIDKKES